MTEPAVLPHQVLLDDRRELTVSGVSDVDSFDDGTVVIHTALGELTVKGSGLHVLRLSTETGDMRLEGQIDALEYSHLRPTKGGLLGKLFR